MKILIVEDEMISRKILTTFLTSYGNYDIAVNGEEAIIAFQLAWQENKPYDLICMDIKMPKMDGQEALQKIRDLEKEMGVKGPEEVKVIMITSLNDPKSVVEAYYRGGATSYLVKPIERSKLRNEIVNLFSTSDKIG